MKNLTPNDRQIKENLEDFYRRLDKVCEYAERGGAKQFSAEWWKRYNEVNEKFMKGNPIIEEAKHKSSKQLHEAMVRATDKYIK